MADLFSGCMTSGQPMALADLFSCLHWPVSLFINRPSVGLLTWLHASCSHPMISADSPIWPSVSHVAARQFLLMGCACARRQRRLEIWQLNFSILFSLCELQTNFGYKITWGKIGRQHRSGCLATTITGRQGHRPWTYQVWTSSIQDGDLPIIAHLTTPQRGSSTTQAAAKSFSISHPTSVLMLSNSQCLCLRYRLWSFFSNCVACTICGKPIQNVMPHWWTISLPFPISAWC